jgi:6-phosphogluconolactonase (cycloisomerase 2 family)
MCGALSRAGVVACALAASAAGAAPLTPWPGFPVLPAWIEGEWQVDVAVSADGRHVYFAVDSFFQHTGTGSIAGRTREPASGFYSGGTSVVTPADPQGLALSRDDLHLYAALPNDDAIHHYDRNPDTGALTADGFVTDGVDGVDGIAGVRDLVVSPDDRHLYAVGDENAVAVFARDVSTGELSFVERERDGVAGVDGLAGAIGVAISPDGRHVYVASDADDAVAAFARDLASGALTYVQDRRDGVGGFDGLDGASAVAVSRDGGGVFVAGTAESEIAVLSRDPTTGALGFSEVLRNGTRLITNFATPTALALDPKRPRLVASSRSETGSGALVLFDYDAATHSLTPVDQQISGAESVAITPDGRHAYLAGSVELFRSMSLGPLVFQGSLADGESGTTGLLGPVGLAVTGKHVIAAASDSDAVVSLLRSASALSYVEHEQDGVAGVDGLNRAFDVAVAPDRRHVYVASALDDALVTFDYDAADGTLDFVAALRDGIAGVTGLGGAAGVAVSPDGKHVYVVSLSSHAIAAFARDAETGVLTQVDVEVDGVGFVDGLALPFDVAVSHDGHSVYVAAALDDAVAVFARDAGTGELEFLELERDGVGGVSGMGGAQSVVVSPDDAHVYVGGGDRVAVFGRSPTGTLSFVAQPFAGSVLVDDCTALAMSRGGTLLVATGNDAHQVVAFWRDPATGLIGLAQRETDGAEGVSDLLGAYDLALDGPNLYVAANEADAIAIFAPEPTASALGVGALAACVALRRRRFDPAGAQISVRGDTRRW